MENSISDNFDKKNKKTKNKKKSNWIWVVKITVITFFISVSLYIISSTVLSNAGLIIAFCVLIAFILIGVIFDIVGVAVTSADIKILHSMAAKKVFGAKQAVSLAKNAEKVSNFCNDVVGDIAGVISGTCGAIIVVHIVNNFNSLSENILGMVVTALVAACTVGGKAMGKSIAISKSDSIVFIVGKIIAFCTFKFIGRKK